MKNKKLMLIPVIVLVFALLAGTALAAGAAEFDTAGNGFLICDDNNGSCVSTESASRDLYWAGRTLDLSGSACGGDAIVAGYEMSIADSGFGGSIRAAGYNVKLSDCTAKNNITAVGFDVSMNSGVEAAGVIAMGNTVTFDGKCDSLSLGGAAVYFNGTVNGDADISAEKIILGDDAVITGKLTVHSSTEPEYPAGIKSHEFIKVATSESCDAEGAVPGKTFGSVMLSRLYMILALAVVALLLCLVASKELDKSGETLLAHPVAMPVTGLVTLCAMPVALILLCVTVIGLPTAGLLGLLMMPICFFATTFAGASAGRLVFKNMNKIWASLIGVAVITLLRAVPYLGGLLVFLSICYTLGFFILVCYERIKALKKQPEAAETVAVAEAPAEDK